MLTPPDMPEREAGFASYSGQLVIFLALSVAAGAVGNSMALIPGVDITFWPPVGMVLGVMAATQRKDWIWWITASASAELISNAIWFHNHFPQVLGYICANALEALAGAWLLRRAIAHPERLESPGEVMHFIACAVTAPVVSATIIASIDAASGKTPFDVGWPLVWLGDSSGILVSAPLTLTVIDMWRRRLHIQPKRVLEAFGLGVLLVATAGLSYQGAFPTPYITLPFVMWAGMRFESRGAVIAMALVVLVGSYFSSNRIGVFADRPEIAVAIVRMQIFIGIAAISGLFAAALAYQTRKALHALAAANAELEARVIDRSNRLMVALRAGGLGVLEYDFLRGIVLLDATAKHLWGLEESTVSIANFEARIDAADLLAFRPARDEAKLPDGARRLAIDSHVGGRCLSIDADVSFDRGRPVSMIGTVKDITERREGERRQQMLIDELSHRVKNTLATVQAIAMQSLRGGSDRLAREAFLSRLRVYARGHDLLAKQSWESASLDDLVRQIIASHGPERFVVTGDDQPILLPPRHSLAITLALHELATNAAKYGSLSQPEGQVFITWSHEASGQFQLDWQEYGGPPPSEPENFGFGTRLLQRGLALELAGKVELDFRPSGLFCTISAPLPKEPGRATNPVELAI